MPAPVQQKVVMQKVVDKLFLETDGTGSDRYVEVDLGRFATQGYLLESIRAVTETDNRTTNHRWKAVLQFSTDGRSWYPTTPDDLFGYVTSNDSEVQAEYTTATNFAAPRIRISLATSNGSGTSRESATVSLWLIFTYKS